MAEIDGSQKFCCWPDMYEALMRPFKWGTTWSSISRDIRNTSSQTFGYPSLLNKVGLFWHFWIWLVANLTPLVLELHQYLILKVSLMVKTYLVGKSVAVLLHNLKLIWKVPILLHTEQIVPILFCRTVHLAILKLIWLIWLSIIDNASVCWVCKQKPKQIWNSLEL